MAMGEERALMEAFVQPHHRISLQSVRACAVVASLTLAAPLVLAQDVSDRAVRPSRANATSVDEAALKAHFLRCSAEAMHSVMDQSDGARCAAVQEALRDLSFEGDFARLLAWWRVHRDRPVAPPAAQPSILPVDASPSRSSARKRRK
jgi:hypothetical protein